MSRQLAWVERALGEVGGWGRLHAALAALLALPVLLTGMYGTNYVFLAAETPHRCYVPECEGANSSNSGVEEWTTWALVPDTRCQRWAAVGVGCTNVSFDTSAPVQCERQLYLTRGTIVAEFDLGCQEWKRTLVGTIHNVGMLISLPVMGYASDKWGRRMSLVVSGVGVGALGLLKSFSPGYWTYVTLELLETVLGASVYPAAFVLLIEWLSVDQRVLASLVLGVPLAMGAATLALLDKAVGDWRLWARLAYPPSALLLLYPWLLPDSVRWLAAQGRLRQALDTVKWAARWNRAPVPEATFDKMVVDEAEQPLKSSCEKPVEDEGLLSALFRNGVLRKRLCVCGAWWMSAVFVFYGLAVRAASLAGDRHLNYVLLAAMEVVALVLNTLLLDRVGRRPLLRGAFLVTAAACCLIPLLPDSAFFWATGLYLAGKVGATMSLNALYVYTAELFPTRARHRLLAACSTLGRIGSILAPLTPLLAVYRIWLPTVLFGALPLLSAVLTLLMPETLRASLPDTFADLQPAPSRATARAAAADVADAAANAA